MAERERQEQGRGRRILVPLAAGFEETEAVAIIDVLRRAELDVVVAGLEPGPIEGGHGIQVVPDAALGELDLASFTDIVLPGGLAGTRRLMADERVLGLVRRLAGGQGTVAAICAAPLVLKEAGVAGGATITSHPGVRGELGELDVRDAPRVITSGQIVTSQGPGTALELGLELVRRWCGDERASELERALLVARP